MKQLRFFYSTIFLFFVLNAFSQEDFTLYQLNNIPQSFSIKPQANINYKFWIGIPVLNSYYASLSNSGLRYIDIIQQRSDDSLVINMDNAIQKLAKKNYLVSDLRLGLIDLGFNFFGFSINERLYSRFIYPKDLVVLIWEGNGKSLLGKRANLNDFGFDFMHYREFAFFYNRQINEKINIGAKLKVLNGISNIWTKKSTMGLTTDSITYDLITDGELEIYSSGIEELTDADTTLSFNKYMFAKNNYGLAFDLGASYKYNDKLELFASITDFGFINWKNNTKNYSNNDLSFVFSGLDLKAIVNNGDTTGENTMKALEDSINKTFALKEFRKNYTNFLPSQFYLAATYIYSDKFDFNAIFHTEFIKGRFRPSLTIGTTRHFAKILNANVNYTLFNRSYFNLGTGFDLNLGPVQFYFVSDNLIAIFLPHLMKNMQFRTGINLIFSKNKKIKPSAPQTE